MNQNARPESCSIRANLWVRPSENKETPSVGEWPPQSGLGTQWSLSSLQQGEAILFDCMYSCRATDTVLWRVPWLEWRPHRHLQHKKPSWSQRDHDSSIVYMTLKWYDVRHKIVGKTISSSACETYQLWLELVQYDVIRYTKRTCREVHVWDIEMILLTQRL